MEFLEIVFREEERDVMNRFLFLVYTLVLVLISGTSYALDFQFGRPTVGRPPNRGIPPFELSADWRKPLSDTEVEKLHQAVDAVPADTRHLFDKRFLAWFMTWNSPPLMFSSNSADYAKSPEFFTLVGMGQEILPLVVDKLRQYDMFFALHLYYKLQNNPGLIGAGNSEQEKAANTVKLWINSLP